MTPGTWYSRLTLAQKRAVIARNVAGVRRRREEARKLGLCVCGNPLRKVRDWLYASTCEECDFTRKLKREGA